MCDPLIAVLINPDWDVWINACAAFATVLAVVAALRVATHQGQHTEWLANHQKITRLYGIARAASRLIEAVNLYRTNNTPKQLTRIARRIPQQYEQIRVALMEIEVNEPAVIDAQIILRGCFCVAEAAMFDLLKEGAFTTDGCDGLEKAAKSATEKLAIIETACRISAAMKPRLIRF